MLEVSRFTFHVPDLGFFSFKQRTLCLANSPARNCLFRLDVADDFQESVKSRQQKPAEPVADAIADQLEQQIPAAQVADVHSDDIIGPRRRASAAASPTQRNDASTAFECHPFDNNSKIKDESARRGRRIGWCSQRTIALLAVCPLPPPPHAHPTTVAGIGVPSSLGV